MNKLTLNIWGRNFSLPVVYDVFDNEDITSGQLDAIKAFSKLKNICGDDRVIRYCLKLNKDDIDQPVNNIFKYVMPKEIYVCRHNGYVALLCDYKFDLDNGIAVLYKNGSVVKIGQQDIIL